MLPSLTIAVWKNVEEKHGELSQQLCKVTEEKAANYEKYKDVTWLRCWPDSLTQLKNFSKTTSLKAI